MREPSHTSSTFSGHSYSPTTYETTQARAMNEEVKNFMMSELEMMRKAG